MTELNPNYCGLPPMNLGCIISYKCTPNHQRYNPLLVLFLSSHHGVAFASSCLSICKYAHIVAFKGVEQHLLSNVLVHLHLRRIVDVLRLPTKWRQRKSRKQTSQKAVDIFFNWYVFISLLQMDLYSGSSEITHRSVWPVWEVKVEALVFFWLFWVQDS